jgi:hypothetical protein
MGDRYRRQTEREEAGERKRRKREREQTAERPRDGKPSDLVR